MLLAFVPMYMIAVAYKELNEAEPDCGTTFTWAARAFGPRGWMGGWGIFAADVIVMANLAQIAGSYGFLLVGADHLATHVLGDGGRDHLDHRHDLDLVDRHRDLGQAAVPAAGDRVRDPRCAGGHRTGQGLHGNGVAESSRIQLSWFNPLNISSPGVFAAGILAAIFIYWGWDTAVARNEETADATKTPGRAAVISTVLLLLTYVIVTVGARAGRARQPRRRPDQPGQLTTCSPASVRRARYRAVEAAGPRGLVMTSSMASTLTTILPTARTTLSMAAFKAAPSLAKIHPRHLTPTWSTWGMGLGRSSSTSS